MPIINDQTPDSDEVLNAMGSMFKDSAQLFYNTGVTESTLKNVFYDTLASDSVSTNFNFFYNAGTDLYEMIDLSGITEYIIIEATSLSAQWNANNCKTVEISAGKWLVFCTTGTDAVHRAQIHKSLWYGTNGTDALIDDFTTVTSVQVSHANDVGKQAHYAKFTATDYDSGPSPRTDTHTGTFVNTSTNTNCASWSKCVAAGNLGTTTSDELGVDTSADENNNPADCQEVHGWAFNSSASSTWEIPDNTAKNTAVETTGGGSATATITTEAIILCVGDITWVASGATGTDTDFFTDNSIPLFTAAGTLTAEGADDGTLIFQETASETVTNTISTFNKTVDASNTLVVSISYDGGGSYTTITDATIARATPTGTAVWLRFVITRADTSKTDSIEEWATKYNWY